MDIGYLSAFLGGLLSLLSPCSIMLLPAFFAYAFNSPGKLISRTWMFFLGLLVTLVPLGVFSGTVGSLLGRNRHVLITVVAAIVIVIGVVQLLGIPIPGLSRSAEVDASRGSAISVFFLGSVYAVAGICAGPILGAILVMASLGGSAIYGAITLAIYALGMVVPLLVLALVWQKCGSGAMNWLRPRTVSIGGWHNSVVMVISGLLSVAIGVFLLLTSGTADIGGAVGVRTQFAMENWAGRVGRRVPDYVVVIAAVVLLVAVQVVRRLRRSGS